MIIMIRYDNLMVAQVFRFFRFGWIVLLLLRMLAGPTASAADDLPAAAVQPVRAAPAEAAFVEIAATADTLRLIRAGGYALYLRHGPTNNAVADRVPKVDLNDCATQRPLTQAGHALMASVGSAMRRARIPVGEFRVSPMCRARDSASAAFPDRTPQIDVQLMYVANLTTTEKAPIIANTRRLLSLPVPGGTNRLVLAHAPNLAELLGYYPLEGTLVILRPKGGQDGFDYVASVRPDAWPGLLKQDKQ